MKLIVCLFINRKCSISSAIVILDSCSLLLVPFLSILVSLSHFLRGISRSFSSSFVFLDLFQFASFFPSLFSLAEIRINLFSSLSSHLSPFNNRQPSLAIFVLSQSSSVSFNFISIHLYRFFSFL